MAFVFKLGAATSANEAGEKVIFTVGHGIQIILVSLNMGDKTTGMSYTSADQVITVVSGKIKLGVKETGKTHHDKVVTGEFIMGPGDSAVIPRGYEFRYKGMENSKLNITLTNQVYGSDYVKRVDDF